MRRRAGNSARIGMLAGVVAVFNTINYGGFDDFAGAPPAPGNPTNSLGGDNLNFSNPNSIRGDPRTVRIALGYQW